MRLLREPLLHFLLLGAAIFALSFFIPAAPPAPSLGDKQITVTTQQIALLQNGFRLDNQRDPTPAELQRLIDNWIREEILVREARAQGLDRDDSIVRRRLTQKIEFAIADPAPPADSVLEAYLAAHPQAFTTPDGKLPPLAQIHPAVFAAWLADQRRQALDQLYHSYLATYQVTIQPPPTPTLASPPPDTIPARSASR